MSFLIDTNILSELRKGSRCDLGVAAWFASVESHELYLSVLVLGEIRKGVERIRPRDPVRAAALDTWLHAVKSSYGDRVLTVDLAVANLWGSMYALRPLSTVDGLLAATAKVHGLTLVTRNEADVAGLGVEVINPFGAST